MKLVALSPAALTIGCEVRHKNLKLPSTYKETKYFTAMNKETIWKSLETLVNPKNHNAMQNTPPKPRNSTTVMAHITENQPFLPQVYANFRSTHEHIFLYHHYWYFIQIPHVSKFQATLFGIWRFCTKCKACFLPTDSFWGRQISANSQTLIFNFNNFLHNPRTYVLYHCLRYFIQIPYLSKFRGTLFGI